MQAISINNSMLLKALNDYADAIFKYTESETGFLKYPEFKDGTTAEIACSKEYLEKRLGKPSVETGYPLHSVGFDVNTANRSDLPEGWADAAEKLDKDVMKAIGVGFSALKMYYPADGYIGWHNNCNCPGQNLLMTYSKGGNGYFEWMHPVTKEIIHMEDKPGWTAKVGYYGDCSEHDKIFWHAARTYEPRITVSYVIRDQSMWEYMVEDIQSFQ